jgi:hypothetical protein
MGISHHLWQRVIKNVQECIFSDYRLVKSAGESLRERKSFEKIYGRKARVY